MREIVAENEYDAVITDPPYYDNIIYSEVSDYFYVWQKILLEEEYPKFNKNNTPRGDSIVTNPHLGKEKEDFENEIEQALSVVRRSLKDGGVLAFTYHHSDSESWGELLTSLCRNDFEITATYPINSDLHKFIGGDAVSFDIVIVARPTDDREPTSWRTLRRNIVRTARETRETLEENRDLASGDIGVIEMGKCFQEYSKHHGKVHRAGEIMEAKDVVDQIYGIIQDADLGETDVYLDLLEQRSPSTDDLNKLLRRADATQDRMVEMELISTDATGLELRDWRDETRQAYARDAVEDPDTAATTLDRAHLLRNVYEQGGSRREYLEEWDHDELQALCEDLARVTGDEVYLRMLGADVTLEELGAD
jgi:adenine-specific DNA methylase